MQSTCLRDKSRERRRGRERLREEATEEGGGRQQAAVESDSSHQREGPRLCRFGPLCRREAGDVKEETIQDPLFRQRIGVERECPSGERDHSRFWEMLI